MNAEFKCMREALTFSQSDLAVWLGVDRKTVQRWENGKFKIPTEVIERLYGLHDEFEAACQSMAERIIAMVEEHDVDRVPLVVYMNEHDYRTVKWPDDHPQWPLASMHRLIVWRIKQAVEAKTPAEVVLVAFNMGAYGLWLAGRKDSTEMRAQWAS